MNGSAGQSRFPAASERLDSFVLGEAQTIVLLGGNAIIVFRLLPTLAGLVFKERRLASLRTVMVETIELYGEFRGTQWNSHFNLVYGPGPLGRSVDPGLASSGPGIISACLGCFSG